MTGADSSSVVVLMPIYNDQSGFERSLDSLAKSGPVAVVAVDDGSRPPIQVPQDHFPDLAVRLIRLPRNRGIEVALNVGLQQIFDLEQYRYVARLDAGDTVHPSRMRTQARFLDANPDYGLVGSSVQFVSMSGEPQFIQKPPTKHMQIARAMAFNNCITHTSVMMRLEALSGLGGYSLDYPAAEDYDLFLRMLKSWKFASIEEVLVNTLLDTEGISIKRRPVQLRSRIRLQLREFTPVHINSYLGLLQSAILYLLPYAIVTRLKSWHSARANQNRIP